MRRRNNIIQYTAMAWTILMGLTSCADENLEGSSPVDAQSTPMTFAINYPGSSRARRLILR